MKLYCVSCHKPFYLLFLNYKHLTYKIYINYSTKFDQIKNIQIMIFEAIEDIKLPVQMSFTTEDHLNTLLISYITFNSFNIL